MTSKSHDREHEGAVRGSKVTRFLGPVVLLAAAACAVAPIVLHGPFCGDDFEFHIVSWFDVQQSWQHGIAIPHWMQSVNYGAGEPRFMFYPPLTWMLGAALGSVLPWSLVPVAMIFLFLVVTGFAVRALALEVLPDAAATLAGCFALLSGYALFSAYERTAFAEMMGGFWIPLLLLYGLRDRRADAKLWRRALDGSTLPLALVLAACWLSDGPVGVMGSYLLASVATGASVLARSWAPFVRASLASVLGLALTGAYLIPAAWEQRWADLRAAIDYPVFRIENNWLFGQHLNGAFSPFAMVLERASALAACMIGATVLGALILILRRKQESAADVRGSRIEPANLRRWILLGAIPFAVLLLLTPLSTPVWNFLPKLRFLQYPWRWVLVVEAPMGIFVAAAVWPLTGTRFRIKAAVAGICALLCVASTAYYARNFLRQCKEGDTATDLFQSFRSEGGLEGTDEYEPPDSDHWKIATGLPDACLTSDWNAILGISSSPNAVPAWTSTQGSCLAIARASYRDSRRLRVRLNAQQAGFVVLRLQAYPAWRVAVNGKAAEPTDSRDDGLLAVPVSQGQVNVDVDWTTTPDVVAGRVVTGLAIALLLGLGVLEKRFARQGAC